MSICKNRSLCGPIQYSKCSSPSNFQNWSMHLFTHCFVLNISLTCVWEPHGFCLECSQSCVNLLFASIKAAGIHQSRTDSPTPYRFTKAVRIRQSRKGLPKTQSSSDSPKPHGLTKDPKLLRFTKFVKRFNWKTGESKGYVCSQKSCDLNCIPVCIRDPQNNQARPLCYTNFVSLAMVGIRVCDTSVRNQVR